MGRVLVRLFGILAVLGVAFGVLWIVGLLVPVSAKGTSDMAPSIPACNGRVLVEGFTYRWFRDPQRSEIVAIHASGTEGGEVTPDAESHDVTLVRRVVGLPGDEVVGRERLGDAVLRQRVQRVSTLLMNLGERSQRRKVLGSRLENGAQLALGGVDIADGHQRAAERHPCGEICRVMRQAVAAGPDRLVVLSGPTVFLGKLRKRKRRRILLDPASQFVETLCVGHG